MIPNELDGCSLEIPPVGDGAIVCITGRDPRHVRFALRLQQQFGERVKGWYQVVRPTNVDSELNNLSMRAQVRRIVSQLRHPREFAGKVKRSAQSRLTRRRKGKPAVEAAFFEAEIRRLETAAVVEPKSVEDPNDRATLDEIRGIEPFCLLTFGGAIYRKPLLELVRGLSLNQHDGWCPEYRGANTADWALYHRDLRRFGTTVHLTTSGMDAGPIMRRSQPCLVPWDSPYTCFLRNVVVGTELMCEVVKDMIDGRSMKAYPQPESAGRTFLYKQLTPTVSDSIQRDFTSGWLGRELQRLKGHW
jgi:methionyl-tRNA formyltransferase